MVEMIERTVAVVALRPGREQALAAAMSDMGIMLPHMGRFTERNGLLLARVAPHQLLAMRPAAGADLMAELAPLTSVASLIDVGDSRVAARLAGPGTLDRLAQLVPLDVHPARFTPGSCAQTLMSHLSVLLLCTAVDDYEIQCGRSFARSFSRAFEAVHA